MDKEKILIAYFSCGGTTENIARHIAKSLDCNILEIKPTSPYTMEDLNWKNKLSRSSLEMQDENSRPPIEKITEDIASYSSIFVGFPIWWGICPRPVLTFLETYNLKNKNLVPFATSGGSKIDYVEKYLKANLSSDINLKPGKMFGRDFHEEEFLTWFNSLGI